VIIRSPILQLLPALMTRMSPRWVEVLTNLTYIKGVKSLHLLQRWVVVGR